MTTWAVMLITGIENPGKKQGFPRGDNGTDQTLSKKNRVPTLEIFKMTEEVFFHFKDLA